MVNFLPFLDAILKWHSCKDKHTTVQSSFLWVCSNLALYHGQNYFSVLKNKALIISPKQRRGWYDWTHDQIFKTPTHQLMKIMYLGLAHVVNLSFQNKVIILITSLSKPSSMSLCMRGTLCHSHFLGAPTPCEGFSSSSWGQSSHCVRERRVRGEFLGRLMGFSLEWPDALEIVARSRLGLMVWNQRLKVHLGPASCDCPKCYGWRS